MTGATLAPRRAPWRNTNCVHLYPPAQARGGTRSGGARHPEERHHVAGIGGRRRTQLVEQRAGGVHAGPAAGAAAGPHRQLAHAGAATGRGLADVVLGDSVADADVHGTGPTWTGTSIRPRMRMIVNAAKARIQVPPDSESRACGRAAPRGRCRRRACGRSPPRSSFAAGTASAPAICRANGARWRSALV